MNFKLIFALLLFTLPLLMRGQPSAVESLRAIEINNNSRLAVFEWTFTQNPHNVEAYLPFLLVQTLSEEKQMRSLQLQMGYNHPPPSLQQIYPKKGVKLISDGLLSEKAYNLVAGSFGVSIRGFQKYSIEYEVGRSTRVYYSDPNDFVCTENMMDILSMMPCEGRWGLLSMINIRTILHKRYVGVVFNFTKTSEHTVEYSMRILVEYDVEEPFKNLLRDRIGKCQIYDESYILDGERKIEIDRVPRLVVDHSFIKPITQSSTQKIVLGNERRVVGNWYGLQSKLVIQLTLSQAQSVDIYQLLDSEFVPDLQSVRVTSDAAVSHRTQIIKCHYKLLNWKTQLCFPQHNHNSFKIIITSLPPIPSTIRVIVPYIKLMKSFQNYQIVNRGGQQFMPALIVVHTTNSSSEYFTQTVTDRIPEPDFSLPFHVITFTMSIAGYFWVSLWRAYIKILNHQYQQQHLPPQQQPPPTQPTQLQQQSKKQQ